MRFSRRALTALVAVPALAATAALTACGPSSTGSADGGTGTLVLGMTADIPGLSPLLQPTYQGWFAEAAWDSILHCNEFGEPSAAGADEFEISDDLTTATVHLRDGLTFADGSEIGIDDLEASVQAATEVNQRFADVVVTTDGDSLTMTWPGPVPAMAPRLCEIKLISAEQIDADTLDNTVLASGPYEYDASASTQGSVYKLTKRDDYWDADSYPYENLEIRVFDNETAAVNALKTNQIDGTLVSAATVDEAEKSGSEVITFRGTTTRLLITDHNGETVPALGDVRVRQAMNMVFDRDAIAEQLYRGHADPAYQIFREGTSAYLEDLAEDPYPYDVEAAKQLMADAGYADGFTLQVPFMEGQNHDLLFPYITEQLGQIGITVEQVNLTGPDAITELLSGKFPVPLWQLGNYGESLLDIQDYVLTDGIWNVSHQPDATIDGLWETVKTGSEEERVAAQQEINQYIIDQAWFVPMAYPDGFYAYSPDVEIPQVTDFSALNPLLRDFQ